MKAADSQDALTLSHVRYNSFHAVFYSYVSINQQLAFDMYSQILKYEETMHYSGYFKNMFITLQILYTAANNQNIHKYLFGQNFVALSQVNLHKSQNLGYINPKRDSFK